MELIELLGSVKQNWRSSFKANLHLIPRKFHLFPISLSRLPVVVGSSPPTNMSIMAVETNRLRSNSAEISRQAAGDEKFSRVPRIEVTRRAAEESSDTAREEEKEKHGETIFKKDKKKKVKSLDKIQAGKTLIKGNVTLSPEDYDSLVTHAKKYYTRKNRENELTSQVKDLKRENTALKNTVSEQRSEISRLQSIRERLNIHKLQKELADVKSLLDKVMRFIDIMGLRERLEQFLSQSKTRIKNIEK